MPPFYIKSSDHELYWYVNEDSHEVQLTDNIKEASEFQAKVYKDGKSFYISSTTKQPTVYALRANIPGRFNFFGKFHMEAKPAQADDPEFRFELRLPPPGNYTDVMNVSDAVMNGGGFFIKPAETSSDDTAVAMCGNGLHNELVSMHKHKMAEGDKTYHMLWVMQTL